MKIPDEKQRRRLGLALILSGILGLFGVAAIGSYGYAQEKGTTEKLTARDYMDIMQLYATYAHALDSGNGAARTATFTADGHFISHITKHVPETAQSMGARTTREGRGWTRHLLMNILLTPTPEGAEGVCYALIVNARPKGDDIIKATPAVYRDELVRTPQGWRFKTRHIWHDNEQVGLPTYTGSNTPYQYKTQ